VDFSGKADDARYFNKRSEMAFRCAEAVETRRRLTTGSSARSRVSRHPVLVREGEIPSDREGPNQEAAPGHSPDRADALWLKYALAELPAQTMDGVQLGGLVKGKALSDWDPLDERRD